MQPKSPDETPRTPLGVRLTAVPQVMGAALCLHRIPGAGRLGGCP